MNYFKIQDELAYQLLGADTYNSKGFLGLYTRYQMALNLNEARNIIY